MIKVMMMRRCDVPVHMQLITKRIAMKFYGGVWGGKMNKRLNFGGDLDLLR